MFITDIITTSKSKKVCKEVLFRCILLYNQDTPHYTQYHIKVFVINKKLTRANINVRSR